MRPELPQGITLNLLQSVRSPLKNREMLFGQPGPLLIFVFQHSEKSLRIELLDNMFNVVFVDA